ncbi:MAG: polysaccharide deacetylase family protein [Flavobacteriales bacterium]|nr:polysaccharide deacetylase family protein [Flavobacteriales bacterium]
MLHVLLETPSPRARYVVRHVFERMLGWQVIFVASREELRSSPGARLSYGAVPVHDAFNIPSIGWFDTPSKHTRPGFEGKGRDLVLFPRGPRADVFAAVFHLIALEAEYLPYTKDEHERTVADELPLVTAQAHEFPMVDIWVRKLAQELKVSFSELPEPRRAYRHVLTVDMDNGLKYAARSWQRAMGASAKDLASGRVTRFFERWNVRMGNTEDPYASFVDRLSEVRSKVDRMIAFVLTRGEGRFDHAARIDHPVFLDLLERLAQMAEIGLHPSYESSRDERIIGREREQLVKATGRSIVLSRQHFLRWRMPDTFRALLANGVIEDHSIGFSDRVGFRAGTCTPFPWYDLERDEETPLMLHPFAVMDSALANRTGEGLQKAIGEMKHMSDAVREVKGTFVSVWHDRFLSGHEEFKGGPEAMRELVDHARA